MLCGGGGSVFVCVVPVCVCVFVGGGCVRACVLCVCARVHERTAFWTLKKCPLSRHEPVHLISTGINVLL